MDNQETIFDRFTRERGISTDEMKSVISKRIVEGMNDPNPEKRKQWEQIPHVGDIPTPEEWIAYVVKKLNNS